MTEKKTTKNKKLQIKFLKLDNNATSPVTSYSGDAGIDLYALKKEKIAGGTVKMVSTGIACEIPPGYFGKVFDRSGVASSTTLSVKAGVIDSGYRGEIKIILANTGSYPQEIIAGQKIAQMVILPVPEFELKEVKNLSKTERGEKGFGSTDTA